MEPSAEWIEQYLDTADPYDEIYLTLFSHGVEAVGWVPIEKYPHDFGVFPRYSKELQEKVPARYPMPGPLSMSQLEAFLAEAGDHFPVEWIDQW